MADQSIAGELRTGAVRFFDRYQPSLTAGPHRLVVQQTVDLKKGETYHYYRDQRFVVKAPRFNIPAEDIHSRFPPEGGRADYRPYLPTLVFKNRSLPWERILKGGVTDDAPWLALLVISQEEFDRAGGSRILSVTKAATLFAKQDDHLLLPLLEEEDDDPEGRVQVLDLPLELFRQLVPAAPDLPYLAHLRCVNTADKTPQNMAADGQYAVLVANRLPRPGNNLVFLVSLEGFGSLLTGKREAPPDAVVRLVNPLHWAFQTVAEGKDTFAALTRSLSTAVIGLQQATPDAGIATVLNRAYTPLRYQSGDNAETPVWYRGPFVPEGTTGAEEQPRGQALPGRFPDISGAAAFQLGRLLALSSQSFVDGLRQFLEIRGRNRDTAQRLQFFLESHQFYDSGAPAGGIGSPPAGQVAIGRALVEWLARLVLLYPVPFHYLIPNEDLLPMESLRFYELDNHWLQALADGALSTAILCRRDRWESRGVDIRQSLSEMVYLYRARQLNRQPAGKLPEDFMSIQKTGFLLRSRLVSDWRGAELTVEIDGAGESDLPPLLRLDDLGDGVMLGLARGRIRKLTLKEPKEGLRLGLDSRARITPRNLRTFGLQQGKAVTVLPDYQRPDKAANVVDVAGLTAGIGRVLNTGSIGSAALGLQLIHAPEAQTYLWK